jgi:hypothetical protein
VRHRSGDALIVPRLVVSLLQRFGLLVDGVDDLRHDLGDLVWV